jgi:flagellar biosynthesis protein FlhB
MQNPFYVTWTYSMDETSPKWKDEEEKGRVRESRGLIVFTFTLFLKIYKQKNYSLSTSQLLRILRQRLQESSAESEDSTISEDSMISVISIPFCIYFINLKKQC